MFVRITPGQSTETPIPRAASFGRRSSDSATTPNFVTS